MAFGVGSAGSSLFNTGANATNTIPSETGPDLEEIQTEVRVLQSTDSDLTNLSTARRLDFSRSQGRQGFG